MLPGRPWREVTRIWSPPRDCRSPEERFAEADVPIIQLSIDKMKPPAFHYEIGKRLAPLRNELLYVIALRGKGEPLSFPVEGIDGGSVSMLTIQVG